MCLSEHLFEYMAGNEMETFDCSAILPMDIQNIISQLRAVNNDSERDRFLVDHGDWLIDQGMVDIFRVNVSTNEEYALLLQKQFLCFRTSAEIAQFTKGMNTLNVWELVRENRGVFKTMFCTKSSKLTKEIFESLCQYIRAEEGSNYRAAEESTIYGWEIFLQDIEDELVPVGYEELLTFITGADSVPILGFPKKIEILFFNQETGICRLPYVSTCGLQMWLPRGIEDPKALSELLVRSLKESHGFHKI